jgi:hypothetical protein
MGNMVNSWQQMSKQRAKLEEKVSKYQALVRQGQEQREEYLLERLSKEMGVDLGKIVEEIEKRADADRESIQPQFDKLKADVKHFAIQNRRRLDQAIKTYAKLGIIEGYNKLYPNQPHIRIKHAHDWEGSCEAVGAPGMTGGASPPAGAFSDCDFFFDQELDGNDVPIVVPGHDGLCNRFRAHCTARAGDERRSNASAIATQTLIFSHGPPSMGPDVDYCGFSELWIPMSVTGESVAIDTNRVHLFPMLETEGGLADILLSIRLEQDTDRGPVIHPVTPDRTIYSHYDIGGLWIWEGMEPIHWAPQPINLLLDEPYRLPPMTLLNNEDYGGGEVRVIVTLTCRAIAINRHAEAEIDLASDGFGVEIHEVFLRGAGCIGTFSP